MYGSRHRFDHLPDSTRVDRIPGARTTRVPSGMHVCGRPCSLPDFPGYHVGEMVGRGGFGAVYRAWDETLQREVAIKVHYDDLTTDPASRSRLLDEGRALARVRHPNVLTLYSILEANGVFALVTELIDGPSLSELVDECGPFDPDVVVGIGVDLCGALAAVHDRGLIHRDLKPSNVLNEIGGRLVLTDFGLSSPVEEASNLSGEAVMVGSPLFMSPEQVAGETITPRTDLYGLGVALYNLVTGSYPVPCRELQELFARIEEGDTVPVKDAQPNVPDRLVEVLDRAMARKPNDRFESALEMQRALTHVSRKCA